MDLSNDLISKFVKITNDGNKKETKEGTVYGTTVEYDGTMYVKIDGSDLLTPIDTTSDIKENERVTIMIKDHNATVTGNITSPSASSADVKKVTRNVEEIEGEITEFEAIIADVVHVGELDAEVARIDELIAGKATIEDLTATNAEITNLKAKDAEIENLVAEKATIEDLTATNAEITNLKAVKADIVDLNAVNATIEILDAEVADINTLVNGNLTSDNILSFNITSQNTTMENAFIKDAMIDTVTANKIMSGTIDTNNVTIQSTDGSMLLQGTLLQMKDDNGKVRIQIGKDTGGNFTFILYDESGTGVLIDEEGIKSSDAIADGLIVDAKVADNANISGGKLDIASVITEVNNNNSTTIKSNKIYLDEQGQSLEVAFNSLKTQVETIQDVSIDGDLTTVIEQVQSNTTQIEANKEGISTLVAENTIRKEEIQNLDGEIESVNNTLSSKYSSLEQDVSGFKTTVAETYATKQSVTDVSNNLSSNYSTTSAMNSAIEQKANEITSSVSETYTTKTEFNNLEIGGRNLIHNGNFRGATPSATYMPNPWTFWGNEISIYGSQGMSGYNHDGCVYVGCNLTDGNYAGFYSNRVHVSKLEKGVTYMASFILAKESNVINAIAQLEYLNDACDQIVYSQGLTTAEVISNYDDINDHQYHIPFTMWTGEFSYLQIVFNHGGTYAVDSGYLMVVGNVQIERGNKASDWTPAPEDTEEQISSVSSSLSQTATDLTATFTEMHNNGYSQGITTIDKDGIKVYQSDYSGHTHMCANGFYVHNGSEDVISCTYSGVVVKGNITATSGKIANFTISGNDLIGSNVGMGGASGTNFAFWAGSNTSSSAPFRVGHDGALTATNANITGTINATSGTFSGNIVTNNIVKAYNSVYAGAEVWGGYELDSSGSYVSSQTFTIHGSAAVQIDGNPTRISSVTGEVTIGDASSYNNLRAREIYAQEIIYTDDLRTRSASQLSLSNVSMMSSNAFIEFSSGYGVIRVPDVAHLYLQTGGGAANTSSEVRCTAYKDASTYVNLRAYNLCAQNAVYANGVNVSSDRDRKRDIELYATDALNEICTTPVYTYHLDTDLDEEVKRIGIIM